MLIVLLGLTVIYYSASLKNYEWSVISTFFKYWELLNLWTIAHQQIGNRQFTADRRIQNTLFIHLLTFLLNFRLVSSWPSPPLFSFLSSFMDVLKAQIKKSVGIKLHLMIWKFWKLTQFHLSFPNSIACIYKI